MPPFFLVISLMATYIIADLHLSESKPILTNAFANFYDHNLYLNDKLIIAGDMFDFFVGLDKNSRFQQNIRQIILKARARGVQTLFQCGNRDFLMNKYMAEYFGMKLIGDFYILPTSDGQALLIHGDQLCLHDRSYQKFRSMSKNKLIRFVFMALPLSWRKKIAIKIRKKSKKMEIAREKEREDSLNDPKVKEAGAHFLATTGSKILIHGHFHIFGGQKDAFGEGTHRLGLGMWNSQYSYVKIDRGELKLVQRQMEKNF